VADRGPDGGRRPGPLPGRGPAASAPLAAASLVVGFALAQLTGVRALGGAVLVVSAAVCWVWWRRTAGARVARTLLAAYAALFVAAHLLAPWIGAWPAVVAIAVTMGLLAWALADRRRATGGVLPGATGG
jgi:hypothetical protein